MEWIERQKTKWSPSYADTTYRRLKRNLFPFIGSKPVNTITAPELLALLRKVEARGIIGTAHALKNHCSCIMRYAIVRNNLYLLTVTSVAGLPVDGDELVVAVHKWDPLDEVTVDLDKQENN